MTIVCKDWFKLWKLLGNIQASSIIRIRSKQKYSQKLPVDPRFLSCM